MLMKELLKLTEAKEQNTVELTEFKGKDTPHSAWTDGVLYKGNVVYKAVYEGSGEAAIEKAMKRLSDKADKLDFQECYLGYSPSADVFIQGYDGWWTSYDRNGDESESGNCSPYCIFKLNEAGAVRVQDVDKDISGSDQMWYSRKGRGGLKAAHDKYKDLIDIRLD